MKITLIGLGKMGTAVAERLLSTDHKLTIFNRTLSKMAPLVTLGATPSNSIEQAVKHAEIVITVLLDDQAVLEVTNQLIENMQPNAIHLGLATILPDTAKIVEEKHKMHNSYYVSATVLGVPSVAREGKLMTFCAGNDAKVTRVMPLLEAISQEVISLGSQIFAPNVMKICMNYSLITTIELVSELYVFAEKSGVSTELVQNALHKIYGHPAFKRYVDKIHNRNFDEVNFDMIGGNKDVRVFQEAFSRAGVSPEIGNIVRSRFISALAQQMENKDWSGIYEIIRAEAGLIK
jgi:3-hydroxyisobutyrate dehydrogenase-like beta-hydroxyacid dehydrogenase